MRRRALTRPAHAGALAATLASAVMVAGSADARTEPALAAGGEGGCLLAPDDLGPARAPRRLRYGVTPGIAGSVGASQGQARPVDPLLEERALGRLARRRGELVLHLNRLFSSDGLAAIRRFERSVRRYGKRGFPTEVQLRYHPRPADEGEVGRFRRFVRQAVVRLGRRETLVGLTVTNEVNFPVSPNTSDGSYAGAREALVAGVIEADRVLQEIDRSDVEVGFTFAWRYLPDSDLRFWRELGRIGGKRLARALDYVGLQIYPGLVWPPLPLPGRSAGTEVVDALALLRHCYMPLAGLGRRTALWVTENGYPTNLGRSEPGQAGDLRSTLDSVRAVSGTLGVRDYRYFNLRDNDSGGLDLFSAVGLLRDDYSPKPAFDVLAREIRAHGRRAHGDAH